MLKVVTDTLETIDAYRLIETPEPSPGTGEASIRIACCGVGYVDALVALGRYQVKPQLPHTPGQEVAGVVAAVGAGVTHVRPGDRVLATVAGGFAQFGVAHADAVEALPDAMSFEQAAGFRVNYITALHGLLDRANIQPGERILVMGAAGGVGLAALQVGRLLGAEVIAVASTPEKRAFAITHGAHQALDTSADGWRDRLKSLCDGKGPDVIFDPVCGPLFEPAFRSLNWRGRHLVVGFTGGALPALRVNLPLLKGAALIGVDYRQFAELEPEHAAQRLTQLFSWVSDNELRPPVGRVFPLGEFADCLQFALSGTSLGKTLLQIS